MKKLLIPSPEKKQGPLKLVAAIDLEKAEDMFKLAAVQVVPDFHTQRRAFEKLMPHIAALRDKGCSFQQISGLLNKCGLELQPSTVRDYFRDSMAKNFKIGK